MLEKPNYPDEALLDALPEHSGPTAAEVAFLPIGADEETAVYRYIVDWDNPV